MSTNLRDLILKWRQKAERYARLSIDKAHEVERQGNMSHQAVRLIAEADAFAQAYQQAAAELEKALTSPE